MTKIIYLDQNAWVALAKGSWDKAVYPNEHKALSTIVDGCQSRGWTIPLSHTNIYETAKINDPNRRAHIARVQATISQGLVFRSWSRILSVTLDAWLADHLSIPISKPEVDWFLSKLWFEAAAEYSPEVFGIPISPRVIDFCTAFPQRCLFDYLTQVDEDDRKEVIRNFSLSSFEILSSIEARRARVADQKISVRRRVYAVLQINDYQDSIFAAGQRVGKNDLNTTNNGGKLLKLLANEIPVLRVERELATRLEDQTRQLTENDLRDMQAFITTLPLADILVGEKQFVNLAKQARLGELYNTTLLTSVFDLASQL